MSIQNRTLFENDNLYVMRGMDSQSVDLIYLDPPFNSNKNYAAPIDSKAAGAAFKDTWTLDDLDNEWHGKLAEAFPALYTAIHAAELTHSQSMKSYLIMMAIRLIEMNRILKDTGNICLHCDPTASHYLKLAMDSVFGKDNFLNEVAWTYRKWTNAATHFQKNHDVLLIYASTKGNHTFNKLFDKNAPQQAKYKRGWDTNVVEGGIRQLIVYNRTKAKSKIADGNYDRVVYREGNTKVTLPDHWNIPILNSQAKERTGYPTQKPLVLVERIIKVLSNPGDMVLDPFCGCATAPLAAEKLQRKWIGIEIGNKGIELVKLRFKRELGLDERDGILGKIIHRTDVPRRSEKYPHYKNQKHELYGKQEGYCNGCKTHFQFRNLTIDHIIPKAKGGNLNDPKNLQLLCNYCNSLKGDRYTHEELIITLKEQGII